MYNYRGTKITPRVIDNEKNSSLPHKGESLSTHVCSLRNIFLEALTGKWLMAHFWTCII
ncbi:hypothetical protein [Chitinophaga rhizophila]|uniref:Uncharacterized protein n=1 Tax=Chitinophaga rhizophila TaxID=2866212 RepID=A0ABS7G5S6_9BACT|nr:hypothetical protein [Chitinophaga rhizophila]MBW8682756.1 hypothetical protein [Chitinophaga rhizophila]